MFSEILCTYTVQIDYPSKQLLSPLSLEPILNPIQAASLIVHINSNFQRVL